MFVTFCFPSGGFGRTSRFSFRKIGHAHLGINMYIVTYRQDVHDLLGQNKTCLQTSIKRSPSVLKLSPDDNAGEVGVEGKLYPSL